MWYFDCNNIFLAENITNFSEYIDINNHVIKLKKYRQLIFGLVYSLKSVELEMLKNYIQPNLANSFIQPPKSLARAFIFFYLKIKK